MGCSLVITMIVTQSFSKHLPVADGTIFDMIGAPPAGLQVTLANMDDSATMVYKFQSSDDGVTWTDIALPIDNVGGTAAVFSIVAGGTPHALRIAPAHPRVRMVARGDLNAEIGLMWCKVTDFDVPPSVNLIF